MSAPSIELIENAIQQVAEGRESPDAVRSLGEAGVRALPALGDHLLRDSPIDVVERLESIVKSILLRVFEGPTPGAVARELATFQKRLGFLLKYKSYAVKCSTPLGYSVFLQQEGQGFSFQRHVTRKTEVFHIVEVHPGGHVFLCTYDEWLRAWDRDAFAAWLAGRPDPRYDRHRVEPRPGDVFVIDRLNVVHTVVGCVLEEFATVSTDMVDRLYDQNAGRPIPAAFDRRRTGEKLGRLSFPRSARRVRLDAAGGRAAAIEPVAIPGGVVLPLEASFVVASRFHIDPGRSTDLRRDEGRAAMLHVTGGAGRVIVADDGEASRVTPPSVPVQKSDVLLVAPGIHYAFVNEGGQALEISEHRIAPAAALA